MTTIRITHSSEEGTLVDGDCRPHHGLLRDNGFRWAPSMRQWIIRGSRDHKPQTHRIERAAQALRDVGFDVEVELDDSLRPIAEREAALAERLDDRQDALEAKAVRKSTEADALLGRADSMAEMMNGQPILVGHHSEKRHRREIDRMQKLTRKGIDTYREGQEAERKANASRSEQDRRASGPTTKRRIDTLEAELRDVERKLEGKPCQLSGKGIKSEFRGETRNCPLCGTEVIYGETMPEHFATYDTPAAGDYRERMLQRQVEINDDLTYWREHLATIGFELLGKADFKPGDPILVRGRLCTVVRANPKTVSVTSQFHSWPIKYGYEDVAKPTTIEEPVLVAEQEGIG